MGVGWLRWGGAITLCSHIKESGLYSGGSREPLNGVEEGRDPQIPFQKGLFSHWVSLLAGGARQEVGNEKGANMTAVKDRGCAKALGMERKGKKKKGG